MTCILGRWRLQPAQEATSVEFSMTLLSHVLALKGPLRTSMKGATPVTVGLDQAPTPPHPPAHLWPPRPDFERPLYDLMARYRLLTSHSHAALYSRDGRLRGKRNPLNCTLTGDRDLQPKLTDQSHPYASLHDKMHEH